MSITNFQDLHVWQEGKKLGLSIYMQTRSFPHSEQFGLTNQMRRAAISITSNIAEGFVRKGFKEKIQFYYTALGSTAELKSQLIIACEIGYMSKNDAETLIESCNTVGKLLNGLIKSTNRR